jgi:hypothetical protein
MIVCESWLLLKAVLREELRLFPASAEDPVNPELFPVREGVVAKPALLLLVFPREYGWDEVPIICPEASVMFPLEFSVAPEGIVVSVAILVNHYFL